VAKGVPGTVANDWKQPLHFVLGIADFLQDKAEELRQEILERGQEKSEDLREFVYDILENVPAVLRREPQKAADEENPAEVLAEDQGGLLNHYVVDDLKETVRDIMDGMGLATRTDVEDLNEKLDRLNQTVKNLIRE
jgi:polyhydroxyalkanoate synthesis regulator phasin